MYPYENKLFQMQLKISVTAKQLTLNQAGSDKINEKHKLTLLKPKLIYIKHMVCCSGGTPQTV